MAHPAKDRVHPLRGLGDHTRTHAWTDQTDNTSPRTIATRRHSLILDMVAQHQPPARIRLVLRPANRQRCLPHPRHTSPRLRPLHSQRKITQRSSSTSRKRTIPSTHRRLLLRSTLPSLRIRILLLLLNRQNPRHHSRSIPRHFRPTTLTRLSLDRSCPAINPENWRRLRRDH